MSASQSPTTKQLESAYQNYIRYHGCPEGKIPEELAKINGAGPLLAGRFNTDTYTIDRAQAPDVDAAWNLAKQAWAANKAKEVSAILKEYYSSHEGKKQNDFSEWMTEKLKEEDFTYFEIGLVFRLPKSKLEGSENISDSDWIAAASSPKEKSVQPLQIQYNEAIEKLRKNGLFGSNLAKALFGIQPLHERIAYIRSKENEPHLQPISVEDLWKNADQSGKEALLKQLNTLLALDLSPHGKNTLSANASKQIIQATLAYYHTLPHQDNLKRLAPKWLALQRLSTEEIERALGK